MLGWTCASGHEWQARAVTVKRRGCPSCRHATTADTIAKSRGGVCTLAGNLVADNFGWRCAAGHSWLASLNSVKNMRTWCPTCHGCGGGRGGGRPATGLELATANAAAHGGTCTSTTYETMDDVMGWRCANAHEWKASLRQVRVLRQWCTVCAAPVQAGLELAHALARENGGECLDTEWAGATSPLRWRCAFGHEWVLPYRSLKSSGAWCVECRGSRVRHSLDTVQAYARNRGGECLSVSWAPAAAQLWRCKLGHEWSAKFHAMNSRGIWCPSCAGAGAGARAFASAQGGSCLSAATEPPQQWRCALGHEWSASFATAQVAWCPYCPWAREEECRLVLERLTGDRFPRSSLNGVELDGYNARLRIAFEYQGEPVQLVTSCWDDEDDEDDDAASQRELAWQQKRDACHDEFVALIEIPHTVADVEEFVWGHLKHLV
jgi:hypothetical protein